MGCFLLLVQVFSIKIQSLMDYLVELLEKFTAAINLSFPLVLSGGYRFVYEESPTFPVS